MAHINLHELHQAGDQKHEGENDQSEEGVAGDLADNITIQNAHDARVQCTTLSVLFVLFSVRWRGIDKGVASRNHRLGSRPFLLVYFESNHGHGYEPYKPPASASPPDARRMNRIHLVVLW